MIRTYPFLVGVTGGLGSGKSTVCRFLAEMGCKLFEADTIAKELQLIDPDVIKGVKALFGENIYSIDRTGQLALDRKTVASIVFSSPEKLQALNGLIHPKVFREFNKAILEAAKDGTKMLVKEAAILFESGKNKDLDVVVVVIADIEQRIERAVLKGIGSREEIQQRIARQWPQEKLIEKADYVLVNTGSQDALKKETESLYIKLLQAACSVCNHV
ncbi:MAG: dephospho-CoA kinase [Chlorobium sp.]|jgi:dephospho-CoA kinase|nr:MAG: dephospho-CoA kinase [Chlorobium sp.]